MTYIAAHLTSYSECLAKYREKSIPITSFEKSIVEHYDDIKGGHINSAVWKNIKGHEVITFPKTTRDRFNYYIFVLSKEGEIIYFKELIIAQNKTDGIRKTYY